jgi:hypothetical protein
MDWVSRHVLAWRKSGRPNRHPALMIAIQRGENPDDSGVV